MSEEIKHNKSAMLFLCAHNTREPCIYFSGDGEFCIYKNEKFECESSVAHVNAAVFLLKSAGIGVTNNMSEEQTEYKTLRTGPITYTELLEYICGFARQKMFQNTHKDDPLVEDIYVRNGSVWEEVEEADQALDDWIPAPSEEKAIEYLNECGDVINEIIFTAAKVAGYTSLIRK